MSFAPSLHLIGGLAVAWPGVRDALEIGTGGTGAVLLPWWALTRKRWGFCGAFATILQLILPPPTYFGKLRTPPIDNQSGLVFISCRAVNASNSHCYPEVGLQGSGSAVAYMHPCGCPLIRPPRHLGSHGSQHSTRARRCLNIGPFVYERAGVEWPPGRTSSAAVGSSHASRSRF